MRGCLGHCARRLPQAWPAAPLSGSFGLLHRGGPHPPPTHPRLQPLRRCTGTRGATRPAAHADTRVQPTGPQKARVPKPGRRPFGVRFAPTHTARPVQALLMPAARLLLRPSTLLPRLPRPPRSRRPAVQRSARSAIMSAPGSCFVYGSLLAPARARRCLCVCALSVEERADGARSLAGGAAGAAGARAGARRRAAGGLRATRAARPLLPGHLRGGGRHRARPGAQHAASLLLSSA